MNLGFGTHNFWRAARGWFWLNLTQPCRYDFVCKIREPNGHDWFVVLPSQKRTPLAKGSPVDTAMQAAYTGEKGSPAAVAGTEGGLAIEPRAYPVKAKAAAAVDGDTMPTIPIYF